MSSKQPPKATTVCAIKNTDDPIDQATLQKLVDKLKSRADTLFDAARDSDSQNVDNNGKGHARAFISGQATAYRRAAEMLEALYELPF